MQGQMVAEGVAKMGPAPTRKGLEDFLKGLDNYSKGVLTGLDWRPADLSKSVAEDCFTIAHWQDSKGGWIQATEKFPFCYGDAKQFSSPALEQGN
jgi:hypothetical protein